MTETPSIAKMASFQGPCCLPAAENFTSPEVEKRILTQHVFACQSEVQRPLNILEAGCGRKWPLKLTGLEFNLTGIDLDENALEIRKTVQKDLDTAIVGDLRTVKLPQNSFDLVFSSNVLEHIDGAERALENLLKALKPGGYLMLIFPNGDSAYSFVARMTPFWVHVWYKRYIQKVTNAGKPGFDPYPVHFDRVVSRRGFHAFCKERGLILRAEYRVDRRQMKSRSIWFLIQIFMRMLAVLSLGRLSVNYRNLVFIVQKPHEPGVTTSGECQNHLHVAQ